MNEFAAEPDPPGPEDQAAAQQFDEMRVRQLDNGLTEALRTLIRHPETGLEALAAEQALAAVPEAIAAIDKIGESWFEKADTSAPQAARLAADRRPHRPRARRDRRHCATRRNGA